MDDNRLLSLREYQVGDEIRDMIVVAVKKIYGNDGFVIFACKGGFSVKGNYPGEIYEGSEYIVSGKITAYGGNLQLSAESIEITDNENSDNSIIAAFLEETFDGIGKKTAHDIASEYGNASLDILLNRPLEAAKKVKGLSLSGAREISGKIDKDYDYLKTLLELQLMGLSYKNSHKVYEELGMLAAEDISKNPYILMRISGIGFEACEKIARKAGTDLNYPGRYEGAIVASLAELHETTGDTYFTRDAVKTAAMRMIRNGMPSGQYNAALAESSYNLAEECAVEDKYIVIYKFDGDKCIGCNAEDDEARFSSRQYFNLEAAIKREIESFIKAPYKKPDETEASNKIDRLASGMGIVLDDMQMKAVMMCMYRPISIITGGPGTGKTTITGILAAHFKKEKIKAEFCAPTGRAAKRLSEASGVNAKTVHRLLEVNGDPEDTDDSRMYYGRNRGNPIEARVVVADEASMIDTKMFSALLNAIRPDSSLILIGDPDQLPSVGPGNILSDLLTCQSIPRVRLSYVFRSENDSSIASNSQRILQGLELVGNDDEFRIVNVNTDEEAAEQAVKINRSLTEEGADFAVLCPTKQNLAGTINLNTILQDDITSSKEGLKVRSDLTLNKGDKVLQIRNNYKIEYFDPSTNEITRGIFNGEIGRVGEHDFLTGCCDIIFDGKRKVEYDKKMLSDIDLAYAMTVHKAQGCEFDVVVIVLGKMNYKLSNRKLLYTAVTRGKKRVIIINSDRRLKKMLTAKSDSDSYRNTSLKDFLKIVDSRYDTSVD